MSLKETIAADLKISMKAGNKQRTSVLRMLLAEILAGEKATDPVPEFHAVKAYHKRLVKSKDDYGDVAKLEELDQEIAIAAAYLPQGATKSDVVTYLRSVDLTADFKSIMVEAKKRFPNDGRLLAETLKELQQGERA